jgi:hypothetical protein
MKIDKSEQHVLQHGHEMIYFGKYDFGTEHIPYQELDAVYKRKHPKEHVMAAAIIALDFNDGEYVKKSGKYDFVDIKDTDGINSNQYVLTKMSNSAIMKGILATYPALITDEIIEEAKDIISQIEMDFMFKVLGDDMNEFEKSINQFLTTSEFDSSQLGVCAYLPTYFTREADKRTISERGEKSKHFGNIGDKFDLSLDIISAKFIASPKFGNPGYMVNAFTEDDNRVSFFTIKDEIGEGVGKTVKVTAKVKSHGQCWSDDSMKETKLNYVKLI